MKRALYIAAVLAACITSRADDSWHFAIGQAGNVTRGLVAHYSMSKSGSTVFDEWGSMPGTVIGSPSFSRGAGVLNDGVSALNQLNYISVDGSQSNLVFIHDSAVFTVTAWIIAGSNASTRAIVANRISLSGWGFAIWVDSRVEVGRTNALCGVIVRTGVYSARPTSVNGAVSGNQWNHVAFSGDGTNAYLHINGVMVSQTNITGTASSVDATSQLTIGIAPDHAAYGAIGMSIDEVLIYNQTLTTDELRQQWRKGMTIYNNR